MQNEDMADKEPATKGDIRRLAEATKGDIRRLAHEIVKTQASIAKLRDEMMAGIRRSHSTILERMDRFMLLTRKVSVDNTFIVHRLDKLEKRVDVLETRG